MHFYQLSEDRVLTTLNTTSNGLTTQQAKEHLKTYGKNEILPRNTPWWQKIIAPFINLFMAILVIAAIISFVSSEYLDGSIILFIMAVTAVISYIQEASSERIFKALRQIDVQNVSVWRDGSLVTLPSTELVPGDIVELRAGQKSPADARLLRASAIRVDESLLTGESKPISKRTTTIINQEIPIYEQLNMLFAESSIISGECRAVVVATGNSTEFGKLASLANVKPERSPVQKKIDSLIGQITIAVGVAAIVVLGLSLYRGLGIVESIHFVLAMAVAAIPESLPVSISVVLVLAARKLAKQNALVRNLSAIENIGIITTIATDKTGTLTQNKLTVHNSWQLSDKAMLPLALLTQLAVNQTQSNGATHDPLDTALDEFSRGQDTTTYNLHASYPFNQALAMSGNAWRINDKSFMLAIKGSPETIIARCALSDKESLKVHTQILEFTSKGYRVIALASSKLSTTPGNQLDQTLPERLHFIGLLAVADELRPEAKPAVTSTLDAGVEVRMITGDHLETAYAIGKQLGMVSKKDQVFDCRNMANLSDDELGDVIDRTRVFSRVIPEYKHRILEILKLNHITAMTGDGVNDVPALSNAHIGIAMGSGSQVAKEAGDLVLLDDNFASIVAALRQGRVVFDNIQRMVFYLLSTNAGEVIALIGALVFGVPVPLLPVQILWINIVTDTTMEIPLGLQPAEHEVLKRPPRNPNKPILGKSMIIRMLLISISMAAIALGTFIIFWQDNSTAYARTVTFNALVAMQWANAFNARREWQSSIFSRSLFSNKVFYGALLCSILVQFAALFTPLRSILHFVEVDMWHLAIPGISGIIVILLVGETHKYIGRRWFGK